MDSKTLMEKVANRLGVSTDDVTALTTELSDLIASSLIESDTVAIPSFGNFESRKRLERISVHPSSGKRLLIPPKMVVSFKPSTILKNRLR